MTKTNNNLQKIKKIYTRNVLSIIFMVIVFVGSLGVGVCLLLSEILFPNIYSLFACPIWYQILMFVSLAVAIGGIVGCGFTKNRSNTTKLECNIELALFLIGFICMIVCALFRPESHVLDVLICVGGAISSVGFFCGIASFIGRVKKLPKGTYEKIYYNQDLIPYTNLPALPNSATLSQIIEVEKYFDTRLPNELVDFLLEFNGDGNLMFSADEIISTTKLMRETFKNTTFDVVDKFCFFGGDGTGNYFCYKILDNGLIEDGKIYMWNNKTSETKLVANTIKDLIIKFYCDKIKID